MSDTNPPLVLLIEDDLPMRRFLRTFLSGANFRVEEASTGEQGLLLAAHRRPDLVILDLGLPDMDGQELLTKLRDWLKAPIIVLSARNQDAQKIEALTTIAEGFKGVTKTLILSAGREVRVMVDGRRVNDEQSLKMCRQIADKIEEECQYPGQIKVVVIRETHAEARVASK